MTTVGQISLDNFYQSVRFQNPSLADLMGNDITIVALYGLSADKGLGQESADHLRQIAFRYNLPEIHRRILESALSELGYS